MSDETFTHPIHVVFDADADNDHIDAVVKAIAMLDGVLEVREPGAAVVRITRRIDK